METERAVTVERVALGLHGCGAPVHVMEDLLTRLVFAVAGRGAVVVAPTALWLQVGDEVRVSRLQPAELDLGRLSAWVRAIEDALASADPLASLRRASPPRPTRGASWLRSSAAVATSSSAAVLFGGGLQDAVMAGVAGALIVASGRWITPASPWWPLREAAAALIAGAVGAASVSVGASPTWVALGGAIGVLPGLSSTVAVGEAAAGHWSSASARAAGAAVSALQVAAGISAGFWAVGEWPARWESVALPWQTVVAVLALVPLALALMLRAPRRSWLGSALTSWLGLVLALGVGGVGGAAVGAAAVGWIGAKLGAATRLPDLVLTLPAILLLVPGAVGVRGLERLMAGDYAAGIAFGASAVEVACAVAAGWFAGGALASARWPTRSMVQGAATNGG
jgi:uncharacterized membrane protein YjjP (DUF1212 family)